MRSAAGHSAMSMAFYKRSRVKEAGFRRLIPLVLVVLLLVFLLGFTIRTSGIANAFFDSEDEFEDGRLAWDVPAVVLDVKAEVKLPSQSGLSLSLAKRNQLPPRNLDLFPKLGEDHVKIVLYVYNRPQYLRVVVNSLSKVEGIGETLLIVSHDGYFEEMDKIVKAIRFCQVKQIYAPYSPHLFRNSFPGVSPGDCNEKDDPVKKKCKGDPDQYGHHRSPKIVSLKHHWWWMMNTVWDGLEETRRYSGHILFIEEDHFIYPNAYRNLQLLIKLKHRKCPNCYAANLAPSDVNSSGEGWESLVAEKIGNVGYTFNRTIWRKIHSKARDFCSFDEYNWDITMWSTVYPSFGTPVYTLRGSRRSAVHFGKCGLHQGQGQSTACIDNGVASFQVGEPDRVPNIKSTWDVRFRKSQVGYGAGFKGWGGWGDKRDHELCLSFAYMYHNMTVSRSLRHF